MFKECLKYNIVPFIIEDNLQMLNIEDKGEETRRSYVSRKELAITG